MKLKDYPLWKDVAPDQMVEGEHIFVQGMVVAKQIWVVCRWCQEFKWAVEDKPCNGLMQIHLN